MKKLIVALMLAPTLAFGWTNRNETSGSTYDPSSGNSYRWNTDYSGNTHVYGNNYRDGSMWNTNIQSDGNMSGRDSDNNYWNYNAQTGYYHNTDGTTCWGKGQFRQCNQ